MQTLISWCCWSPDILCSSSDLVGSRLVMEWREQTAVGCEVAFSEAQRWMEVRESGPLRALIPCSVHGFCFVRFTCRVSVIKVARVSLAHFIAYDRSGACPKSLDASWEFPSGGTPVYSTIRTHSHPGASCLVQFTSWHEFGWLRQTRELGGTPRALMDHAQKLYTDQIQWHKLVPVFCLVVVWLLFE